MTLTSTRNGNSDGTSPDAAAPRARLTESAAISGYFMRKTSRNTARLHIAASDRVRFAARREACFSFRFFEGDDVSRFINILIFSFFVPDSALIMTDLFSYDVQAVLPPLGAPIQGCA